MKKSVLAVTTAAILAGSAATYAIAQQPPAPQKPGVEDQWKPSPADRAAFASARVAALHAGLALTPEQEQLWPPVEAVLKDMAQKREVRHEERRAEWDKDKKDRPDAMQRLRRGAEVMSETGADLKRLADAAQPLYDKLDDAQKRRLHKLIRHGMHERMREGFRQRAMHRFAEWRDRYEHWRDDDRGDRRDRDDRDNRGSQNSGERL
jgi:hypothetical protein